MLVYVVMMSGFRRLSLVLVAAFLLGAGHVVSVGASDGGIDVYSGGIDMHSNQISNLADPSSAQDAATRSWVNNNDDYEADTNAGTKCSGSDYLAGDGTCNVDSYEANTNTQLDDEQPGSDVDLGGFHLRNAGSVVVNYELSFDDTAIGGEYNIDKRDTAGNSSDDMVIESMDAVSLYSSTGKTCDFTSNGDWTCSGTKSWKHVLNSTHESVYTSQEGPEVRAVYEGQTSVENGAVNVSLPSHFVETVSDERPSLRVQVTPHELATVAVTERTDSWIVIESSKDVDVDYRVTGIREGYEDKQVVRERR